MAYLNLYVHNKPSASKRSAAPSPGGTKNAEELSFEEKKKKLMNMSGPFQKKNTTNSGTTPGGASNTQSIREKANILAQQRKEDAERKKSQNTTNPQATPAVGTTPQGPPPAPPVPPGPPPAPPPVPPGGFGDTKAANNKGTTWPTVEADGATNTNTTKKSNANTNEPRALINTNEIMKLAKLKQERNEKTFGKVGIKKNATTGSVDQSTGNYLGDALKKIVPTLNPQLRDLSEILQNVDTDDQTTVAILKKNLEKAQTSEQKKEIYNTLSNANLGLPDLGVLKQMYKGEIDNTLLGAEDMNVLNRKIDFSAYEPKIEESNDDFIPYLMALWAVHKDNDAVWSARVLARAFARVMNFS